MNTLTADSIAALIRNFSMSPYYHGSGIISRIEYAGTFKALSGEQDQAYYTVWLESSEFYTTSRLMGHSSTKKSTHPDTFVFTYITAAQLLNHELALRGSCGV